MGYPSRAASPWAASTDLLTHPRHRTLKGSCCRQCTEPGWARGGSWGYRSSCPHSDHAGHGGDGWKREKSYFVVSLWIPSRRAGIAFKASKSRALPKCPPLNVLATQADVDALFEQGAKCHVLCQGPVNHPVLHHLSTGFQNTAQTCRDRSRFRAGMGQSSSDARFVPQPAHGLTDCKCCGQRNGFTSAEGMNHG